MKKWSMLTAGAPHVLEKNRTREEARKLELRFHILPHTHHFSAGCFRQLLSPVIWDGKTCGLGDMAGEGLISRKGAQSFLVLRFCNSEPCLPVSLAHPETAKGFASLFSRQAAAHGTGPAMARALSCSRPHPAEDRGAGTRLECEF